MFCIYVIMYPGTVWDKFRHNCAYYETKLHEYKAFAQSYIVAKWQNWDLVFDITLRLYSTCFLHAQ